MTLVHVFNDEPVASNSRLTCEAGEFVLLGWTRAGNVLVRPADASTGFMELPASALGVRVSEES